MLYACDVYEWVLDASRPALLLCDMVAVRWQRLQGDTGPLSRHSVQLGVLPPVQNWLVFLVGF